jgi:anti-sigma28 factor (negative regulator of flagellin synthesis)
MKIDKGHRAYIQNSNLNKDKNQEKLYKDIKSTKNNSVNIDISKSGRKLADKIKENENLGFSKKVEDIRKAVLNDSYEVSYEEIADKIIENIQLQGDDKIDE